MPEKKVNRKEINDDERKKFIELYYQGVPIMKISKLTGISRTTLTTIINTYVKEGRVNKKSKGGLKCKRLTDEQEAKLHGWIGENCGISLRELKKRMKLEFNLSLSERTIQRHLREFYYSITQVASIEDKWCRNDSQSHYDEQKVKQCLNSVPKENIYYCGSVNFMLKVKGIKQLTSGVQVEQANPSGIRNKRISLYCCFNSKEVFSYYIQFQLFDRQPFKEYFADILNRLVAKNIKSCLFVTNDFSASGCEQINETIEASDNSLVLVPTYLMIPCPMDRIVTVIEEESRRADLKNEEQLVEFLTNAHTLISPDICEDYITKLTQFLINYDHVNA